MAAWGILEFSDATLTELGREIGRDVTSLSSAVRRLVERSKKDSKTAERMNQLRDGFAKNASLQA